MHARLMFLRGYISIARGMTPGQLNPDMDDARFALEPLAKDGDPLIISHIKKLLSFIKTATGK